MLSYFKPIISLLMVILELSLSEGRFDYCQRNCTDIRSGKKTGNYLCNNRCRPDFNCHMEKMDVDRRQMMVDIMNTLRNEEAGIKNLSDIDVVHYDMELEYLAQCLNNQIESRHKGHCIQLFKSKFPFMIPINKNRTSYDEKEFFNKAEIEQKIRGDCSKSRDICIYIKPSNNKIGCSFNTRVFNPGYTVEYYFLCTFPDIRPNAKKQWKHGPPASKCPPRQPQRNDKYPNLCGKLWPMPSDPSGSLIWEGPSDEEYLAYKDVPDDVYVEDYEETEQVFNNNTTPRNTSSSSASLCLKHCLFLGAMLLIIYPRKSFLPSPK
ncbi:unnamed protein product [Brassicogethes aeneus]|uniref:Uncharacterized protein n=1 Tax=Brassicogethes aeneus TaxID=1431903 RepID=A0A9P0FQ57_BRAAE|nr:unnamed protein product [Brassicogethes aeneus]